MIRVPSQGRRPAIEVHLLSRVDFSRCLALQQRLVDDLSQRTDGLIRILICEHPDLITIGRGGSPAEVQMDSGLIRSGQLEVRWVNRGGGCLVHTAGQLAVYPIVSLLWHGLSLGEYLSRIQEGILRTLTALGIPGRAFSGRYGVWGRTGQLAAVGIAVRHWVAYHGAFINVGPRMGLFRLVDTDPQHNTRMSCLVAERGRPVRMTAVRAELVRHLTEALGCDRYHLHTGHPWLASIPCPTEQPPCRDG
jgi:lipoyl(octanoyl) transferase